MKILQVITSLRTGGAEKLMVDLLPLLKERGHEVDLLLFDGTETSFRHQIEEKGIKVYDFGKGRSVYSPINFFRLIPFLKKYDIIHTHNTACQIYAALGSLLSSVILFTTEHTTSNRRRGSKWYALFDRWMYSRYNKIISISPQTESNLKKHLNIKSNSKFITIYNGINLSKYKSKFNIVKEKDIIKVIQIAGFRPQKDQDTVIRSLSYLPQNYHLYLVGDGERKEILINLVNSLNLDNRVHFLGVRDDIPNLLHQSDIVIMSSHCEGFGLAAVEGMAASKPVIASNVEGLKDIIEGYGILFDHGDSKSLANEIIKLISDKSYYNNICEKCMERASDFDIMNMADKYSNLYTQHLGQKKKK